VAALGVLVLIEQPYFKAMLETDFRSLYRSYDRGSAYFLLFLLDRMGFLLLGVSFAGYVFAWQQSPRFVLPCFLSARFSRFGFLFGHSGQLKLATIILSPSLLFFVLSV
jgi:hypothetical protein